MPAQAEPNESSLSQPVLVPDLWQQEAVRALRDGFDVVVQAPTGSGKTLIFEHWANQGRPRGKAIYSVPTRALANDKLAEWRARGWSVGIATGDLSDQTDAPIVVATLETQKSRLLGGEGPDLLVIDEYQMLADPDRGLNYELAIAAAPVSTQLLLLSGSVDNPLDVVRWLNRLGRAAKLVVHDERPVPLEEVHASALQRPVAQEIQGYWPRLVASALAEDLGPILIFAPRRQATEALAIELARQLPNLNPLGLTPAQKHRVGESLARLLRTRIAFHHSGLSYAVRAGVIEPLAKAGQLRVVVATMGLAAGINFSLRSVALAGESYRRDQVEQPLRADEILQMFGRAGRRGIDETGMVIVTQNDIRLRDAHAGYLARSGAVDWGALLGIMHGAVERGLEPFAEALRVQARLFTAKSIPLGVESSLRSPEAPCGLRTDAERARLVRKRIREFRNSRGEWEPARAHEEAFLKEIWIAADGGGSGEGEPLALRSILSEAPALEGLGTGALCVLPGAQTPPTFGRLRPVAVWAPGDRVVLEKWVRRLTQSSGRAMARAVWDRQIAAVLEKRLEEARTPLLRYVETANGISAEISLAEYRLRVPRDRHGVALWKPEQREVGAAICAGCDLAASCRELSTATGTALLWRRLGLIDGLGRPTRRGRVVSFFSQGDGLGVAAALEDEDYALEELLYDLADLDAGFRFCGEDNRWGGRLARACQERFGLASVPGYLENGVPPKYGAGAERIVAGVHREGVAKEAWITDALGVGDIDRVIIEWRSLLRQIAHAPELDWPRWRALRELAGETLEETQSPTLTELPPLEPEQKRRIDHRMSVTARAG